MVIGLLAVTAIPTIIGVGNSISAQQKQNAMMSKEQEKFHLTAMLPTGEGELREAAFCVLVDGQIYLDFPQRPVQGHRFCGYYFTYPSEDKHRGLVSTISDDPPALNWIFVDKDTHALRYGGRKDTLGGHVIGPWGWSDDEHFLILQGDPARFVARRQQDGRWAVFWHPPKEKIVSGGGQEDGRVDQVEEEEDDDDDDDDASSSGSGSEDGDQDEPLPIRLRRRKLLGVESQYVRH